MAALPPFKAFTVKSNGTLNRIITDAFICPAFDPSNPPNPTPSLTTTKALWDTGATRSVISRDLVTALNLTPVGTANVSHGGGEEVGTPTYLVNVQLPHGVGFIGVLVTSCPPPKDGSFSVIIGMDIIGFGDFALTNVDGKTCLSFRTPSCEVIDYVHQGHRLTYAGVGRNDPCPCGSGKKYKKCHGA